ncbi:MAG: type II toxin-antitoxin system HicA family toxin [Chloroflexota bacterium]
MPRLRKLSGGEIVTLLQGFGFEIIKIEGSHHKLRRIVGEKRQTLHVPVHGSKPLGVGVLSAIYKQARTYISEEELRSHFYSD